MLRREIGVLNGQQTYPLAQGLGVPDNGGEVCSIVLPLGLINVFPLEHAGNGKVERREFEYERHGTRAFILRRDVVTGKLLASFCGPTRKEDDFFAHMQAVVATEPKATRWRAASPAHDLEYFD